MNIIRSLPPKLDNKDWVAIDLELYGADEKILHRPTTGKFACLSFCALSNPDTIYIIDDETLVQTALDNVNNATWVIHHAKFDITHLRRWAHIPPRKKLWDTYLIEKILWSGYYDKFGLGDLVRRYLSIHLDKSLQKEWGKMDELSDESLEYAAHDVFYGLRVCLEQRNIITKELLSVYKRIDLPVLWAVLDFKGFAINVDKWNEIAPRNKQLQSDADAQLDFNPRSHEKARLRLIEAGFPKLPNVQRPTLEKWIKKYPNTEAARLARIMILSSIHGKRASTYGEKFVSDHVEKEGGVDVIVCDYNVIGAESGRFCIHEDTILELSDGEVTVKDLVFTKDKTYHIISHTGKLCKITGKYYKGREQMYEIQTSNGNRIICTENHRILTPNGWKSIKELSVGDRICSYSNKDISKDV